MGKFILLFVISLSFSYSVVQAQAIVDGVVTADGKVVEAATVSLGKNRTMATDSAGRFAFQNVPVGKHRLVVTSSGFDAYEQSIRVVDSAISVQIELQPNTSSLDAVVISGTMKPVRKLESPIAVEVYSHQFFKKNPTPSVFEALGMINGVRPQINCNVCNTGDIHINGLEGPYTMVTIDGMPIVSALSSVYGLFGIPSQMIDRVEVVKGPASGLYGSEAIGGLINIITKSPAKAPRLSINTMSTSWGEHLVDVGMKFNVGRSVSSLLGINYFNYSNPVDKNGDNFTDLTLQHRVSIFNKWQWQRPSNKVASLAGRYFYEDRWGGEMQWQKKFRGGAQVYGESIYTRRWELLGAYALPVAEPILLSFSATGHNQNSYYGTTPFFADQKILFAQATWTKSVGKQSWLVGAASRYNYYDDNSTATIDTATKLNQPDKVWLPGLFVQNEWTIAPAHQLLFGLRYDHHPVHKDIFTPRFAYKWAISKDQVIRLNTGTGFRVVNLFTEEHAALTGARVVEVKEALKPEQSYNVSLNYVTKLGSRSKAASLDASVWYTHFQNQIIPDYETDPNKIIYDNLRGYAVSKGVSVNVEFNWWQRLKGNIGATVQDVAKMEKGSYGREEKIRPLLTESWSGNWAISYSFPLAGVTLDYTGNLYGPMRLPLLSSLDPRPANSPVWSVQNLQVSKWLSTKWELFGGVKNLFDWTPAKGNPFLIARAHDPFDKGVEYDAAGAVLKTPTNPYALTFDPAYVYAPNQGRRVFAGVRFSIK